MGEVLVRGGRQASADEDGIRCVAATVRGVGGAIVAAVGVSSAAQYADATWSETAGVAVQATAEAIGREPGWNG